MALRSFGPLRLGGEFLAVTCLSTPGHAGFWCYKGKSNRRAGFFKPLIELIFH